MFVLVAEDYEGLRQCYKEHLERAGFRVIVAENGEQALRLYNQLLEGGGDVPGLLLTDYAMPMGTGPWLVSELRKLGFRGHTVLCTGSELTHETILEFDLVLSKTEPLRQNMDRIIEAWVEKE